MTQQVFIYQPAKNAMQSGRKLGGSRANQWVLEMPQGTPRTPEPLMGWVSSADTLNQLCLKFASAEAAVAFATQKGWGYQLQAPNVRQLVGRSYMDNFKYSPVALPAPKDGKN